MIKQLLIGGTVAAATGYATIPGLPNVLNFSSQGTFTSSGGAKFSAAKMRLPNISFTSSLGGVKVNRGFNDGNSISALVSASQKELARKKGNSGAKFISN